MCLVYTDEAVLGAMSKTEFEVFSDEHVTVDEELARAVIRSPPKPFSPLIPRRPCGSATASCPLPMVPFAETKEQLTGFYLIEARDLNDAIQAAAKIPAARVGSIEVRPIWNLRQHEPRARP